MDIERAKAISTVAQTLINSAKVEIEFLEATGQDVRGEFFDAPRNELASVNTVPNQRDLRLAR